MQYTEKERVKIITKVTLWGLLGNSILCVIKIAGGVFWSSQALVADGFHSLSDLITDIPILIGAKYWEKPADHDHPHGHRKIELMVTLFIGAFLALVAIGILINSIDEFSHGQFKQPNMLAFLVAILSIVVKEVLYRIGKNTGKKIGSSALIANAWHHRSDALSSIPTAIAILIAAIFANLNFIDVLGSVVVSIFILKASFDIVKPTVDKLTDRGVDAEVVEKIEGIVNVIEGVKNCHQIRSRYISAVDISIDIHVEVPADMSVYDGHEIATEVKEELISQIDNVVDVIVHIEPWHA